MRKSNTILAAFAVVSLIACGEDEKMAKGKDGNEVFIQEVTSTDGAKATTFEMNYNPPIQSAVKPGVALAPANINALSELTLLGTLINRNVASWYNPTTGREIAWNNGIGQSAQVDGLFNYYYLVSELLNDEFIPDYWSVGIAGTAVTGALNTICTYDRLGNAWLGNTELQFTDFIPYHAFAGLLQETGVMSIADYTGTGISGECVQNRPTYVLDFALSSTYVTLAGMAISGHHTYGFDLDTGNYPPVTIAAAAAKTFRMYGVIAGSSIRFEADYAKPLPPDVGTPTLVDVIPVTVRDSNTLAAICNEQLVYVVDDLAGAGVNLVYQFQIDPTNVAANCLRQGNDNLRFFFQ